jgi:hypothetical protein
MLCFINISMLQHKTLFHESLSSFSVRSRVRNFLSKSSLRDTLPRAGNFVGGKSYVFNKVATLARILC